MNVYLLSSNGEEEAARGCEAGRPRWGPTIKRDDAAILLVH